ncbi:MULTISPECIES: flagellar biosynthesis anti-sigma factor FlgM [Pseudoxanthomonas]|uniref:flagellar biosynthesis anti-sigma factor FlgM n=1 Tax=Pseudoxanthomonas TaxID=83618 RepID=UPI001391BF9A|nr:MULTISPECIES: flagellar biosynthesis anti-sigma factor FlgM [Pseudoxanthomonas]KAF1694493.1 flagellar biosynthesis anti-sigma factor FlgM [Pseudoxanthomonas jiangsuensis]MCR6687119.1 flagellar biosynthesis anti-sigma factor FlgM [Pseudoxanthomonas sp.]
MSQKIEGSTPLPAVHSTGQVGRAAAAGADRSSPVESVQAGDSLRLTGEATSLQALQRELSAAPAVDSARVEQVKQALEAGTYRIDPAKIAERMLDMDKLLG